MARGRDNIAAFRSLLYTLAKLMGDAQAARKRRIGRRIARRAAGKATGRVLGRVFGKWR